MTLTIPPNPYPQSELIKGIRWLSEPLKYPNSHGDVWTCTWADDGHLYSMSDDTTGINGACNIPGMAYSGSNLAVHRIEGNPPNHQATTINVMSEYGTAGYHDRMDSWKGNGMTCVDGVLYLAVSQHSGAGEYPDNIQRTYDCSIIKSTDHGQRWSPKRRDIMFPSPRFSTPFFVEFGQDYADAIDDYVYATSSGCTWNNGNFMTLGRVRRDKLPHLYAGDWEIYDGLDSEGQPTWRRFDLYNPYNLGNKAIFKFRGYTSMTGMQYVLALKRFLLPQWAYTDLDNASPWRQTTFHLYEAPMPWGPWKVVHVEDDWGHAWYNPCLPSKWFEDGGLRMWMVASGDFAGQRIGQGETSDYCLIVRKLELVL